MLKMFVPLSTPKKLFGTVYKLCYDEDSDIFYIGSTTRKLCRRLAEHKTQIKHNRASKKKIEYFKDKIDQLKIIVVEEYFGDDKKELRFRERYWCEHLKSFINQVLPIREKGEYNKLYYQYNKNKIKEYRSTPIECELCGNFITRRHINRHQKTKICKKNRENNK